MHTFAPAAFIAHSSEIIRSWSCIVFVAALAISGECLIAAAMRRLGDLDALRTGTGLRSYLGPIRAVLSSPIFLIGALCMALNFFAMLFTLSLVDLSLAAPAIGSATPSPPSSFCTKTSTVAAGSPPASSPSESSSSPARPLRQPRLLGTPRL